ncbi:MAG: hypothetical protein A2X36_01455 [Elusimicrobia bacterium GWA2_69_24]|nr:MAG: hypothetical protein A2X36_01455 [Elusimicrobia bacterium GWA2_69_24]HBL17127.1 hypothetical protein [Elusimicrobiota bacterium]
MKTILRIAAVLVVLAALGWAAAGYYPRLRYRWDRSQYPAIRTRPQFAGALQKDIDLRRRNEFARRYQRITALIDAAEEQGLAAAMLRPKMENAARLAREGNYFLADVHLNSIELRVPRRRERLRPATVQDEDPDAVPDADAAPVRRRKARR